MENIVAEILHLKKSFGNNTVLNDMSFKLHKGENLVILGKSGSGKSVLIKCMVGLIEADAGKITLLEKNISTLNSEELNTLRKKIGFLFQSAALYDSMTVRENLEFPLRDKTFNSTGEKKDLVLQALENVGLAEAMNLMPSELSGGMKKRIGLARTLILNPEIILYDEPTTGLDPITSKEISQLILEIKEKYQTASVIITHDLECARTTSDRVIVIKDGTSLAEGSYHDLSTSKDKWLNTYFN